MDGVSSSIVGNRTSWLSSNLRRERRKGGGVAGGTGEGAPSMADARKPIGALESAWSQKGLNMQWCSCGSTDGHSVTDLFSNIWSWWIQSFPDTSPFQLEVEHPSQICKLGFAQELWKKSLKKA